MAALPPVILRGIVLGTSAKGTNPDTGRPSDNANLHVLVGFDSVAITYPRSWGPEPAKQGTDVEVECTLFVGSGSRDGDNDRVAFVAREVRRLGEQAAA